MYLMIGLWLMSLVGQPFLMYIIWILLFLKLCHYRYLKGCILWFLIGIIFLFNHQSGLEIPNGYLYVDEVSEDKITFRHRLNRFDYYGDTEFNYGDRIQINNLDIKSYQDNLKVRGIISDDDIIYVKNSFSVRKIWSTKLDNTPLLKQFFERELNTIFSVLSLQLWGFLKVFEHMYRKKYSEKHLRLMQIVLCIFYGLLFGISFGFIRILLSLILKKRERVICCLLILFPFASSYAGFYLVYLPFILKKLSLGFDQIHDQLLQKFLLLRTMGRLNILELVGFRLLSYFSGCLVWLSLFGFFNLSENLLKCINTILDNPIFLIVGAPSMLWIVFFCIKPAKTQIVVMSMMIVFNMYYPFFRVSMIQVYQGDATLITFPFNIYTVLIDTGKPNAYNTLKQNLYKMGIKKIDALIITHPDLDHNGNQVSIIETFNVEYLVENKGETLPFFDFLLSDIQYEEDNANSLITYFEVYDKRFLLMGDAGVEQENEVLKQYPNMEVDVLKLGHHGSNTSSSDLFLKSLKPDIALISSDPRIYNHPHPKVMRRLQDYRIVDLQTSIEGTITFKMLPFLKVIVSERGGFGIMK